MKAHAINRLQFTLICLLLLISRQNAKAQLACPITTTEILSVAPGLYDLDDLMANPPTNRNSFRDTRLIETSWTFLNGPIGARGPRTLSLNDEDGDGDKDDVDFPNTGAGPQEAYTFEHTITDGACSDTKNITIKVFPPSGIKELKTLYFAKDDSIENPYELFNAFSLKSIRCIGTFGSDCGDFSNSNTQSISLLNWYEDFAFGNDAVFPLEEGLYVCEDDTSNSLEATVKEISSSENDIYISFANSMNTMEGDDNYYEVDIMIESDPGDSFKLGDGKLFFKYNNAAFGNFINAYGNIEVTAPAGYVAGQTTSSGNNPIYSTIEVLDNTNDVVNYQDLDNPTNIYRFSLSFTQIESATEITANNVNDTPRKLCRLKIKYDDFQEEPNLTFEPNSIPEPDSIYDNKFTTACGWDADGSAINCNVQARTLIVNDTFDSTEPTFANQESELLEQLKIYPNPTYDKVFINGNISNLERIEIFSISGRKVIVQQFNLDRIDLSNLEAGIYFVKLQSESSTTVLKLIKK